MKIGFEPPGSTEKLRVPCGSCFGCRMEYAEKWSVRLEHEAMTWNRSAFITLTYDDDNLPWRGLLVDDLQRFMKRLRKATNGDEEHNGRKPIRYFAVGEYGGDTRRPHFHAALFNADLKVRQDQSEILREVWPQGFHTVGEFTPGRARYIAGYAVKKIRGKVERERELGTVNFETGEYYEQKPEFAVMSRRPGIGAYFFEKFQSDLKRGYVTDRGGIKRRLPRFYQGKLLENEEWAYDHETRTEQYRAALPPGSDTEERRLAKERTHIARIGLHGKPRGN